MLRLLTKYQRAKGEGRQRPDNLELLRKASFCFAEELSSLRMTAQAHEMLRWHTSIGHLVVRNSLIIAFAVHFRNIFDFLYSGQNERPPSKDDVLAEHFFDTPEEWHRIVPMKLASLIKDRKKLNKHFAHVTYSRVQQKLDDRFWEFQRIMEELSPAVLAFAEHVDQRKLNDNLHEELSASTWKRINQRNRPRSTPSKPGLSPDQIDLDK